MITRYLGEEWSLDYLDIYTFFFFLLLLLGCLCCVTNFILVHLKKNKHLGKFPAIVNDWHYLQIPSYVTANARSLISECLKKNPRERIKLQAIPHHPFMAVGGKTDISRTSDSGLYTMTTVATTQHTRPPLTTISESDLSDTESSGSENRQGGHHHRLPYLRHPPSPPIRMKSK